MENKFGGQTNFKGGISMENNPEKTNPNDVSSLVNENFVINFLEPPANTSATKKKMKEFESIEWHDGVKRKITECREVYVPRFDEKECHEKALEIKNLFEEKGDEVASQELIRQLQDENERRNLSKLKKYLYNRKSEGEGLSDSLEIFFGGGVGLHLVLGICIVAPILIAFVEAELIMILASLATAALSFIVSGLLAHNHNKAADARIRKENQFKENVLNKIKETQINSVFPEVPVENDQNLIPYSSIDPDPNIPPAWIPVANLREESNKTSNMPTGYSSGAYNQSPHK